MSILRKHNFKKLVIWQDAMELCDLTYIFCETVPVKEKYNLIIQLERCAVSIPSNIAEGSGKRTNLHFGEFLTTSLSSSYEMETQLLICKKRNYGDTVMLDKLILDVCQLQSKIFNFREKIIKEK
ncbi:MAG TPA: four helix bundle protein [Bacteroidia bacterium]|nr:four helix bundle protein [Bacteroidia bacterium]